LPRKFRHAHNGLSFVKETKTDKISVVAAPSVVARNATEMDSFYISRAHQPADKCSQSLASQPGVACSSHCCPWTCA